MVGLVVVFIVLLLVFGVVVGSFFFFLFFLFSVIFASGLRCSMTLSGSNCLHRS
jgi:predicted RND superfamily exporter protein